MGTISLQTITTIESSKSNAKKQNLAKN